VKQKKNLESLEIGKVCEEGTRKKMQNGWKKMNEYRLSMWVPQLRSKRPPHSTLHVLRRAFDRTSGDGVESSHILTTNNVTPTYLRTERRTRRSL